MSIKGVNTNTFCNHHSGLHSQIALGSNGENRTVNTPPGLNFLVPSPVILHHILPPPGPNSAYSNVIIDASNPDDTATYHFIFLCSYLTHTITPITTITAVIPPTTNGSICSTTT